MKNITGLIFIFSLSCFSLFAGNVYDSIPSQETVNKLIKKGEFLSGKVYTPTDTLSLQVLQMKGVSKYHNFKYCITKTDLGTIQIFPAYQISGYSVNADYYKKHFNGNRSFFIKQTIVGEASLFEKEKLDGEDSFLYYILLPGYSNLFMLDPFQNNVLRLNDYIPESIVNSSGRNSGGRFQVNVLTNNIPLKFKLFIQTYFSSCPKLVNMVQNEFYTINDIPSIINFYNTCGVAKEGK